MKKVVLSGLIAAFVAGCSELPVDGLTRSGWDGPSELPPIGHASDTWVDSRGCVFFATASGWVPHVGGNLRQVCS